MLNEFLCISVVMPFFRVIKKDVVCSKLCCLRGRFQGNRCTGTTIKFLHLKPDIGKLRTGLSWRNSTPLRKVYSVGNDGVTKPDAALAAPTVVRNAVEGAFLGYYAKTLMIMLVGSLVLFAGQIASSISGTPEVPQHVLFHVTSSKSEDTPDICISYRQHVRPQRLQWSGIW